MEQRNGSDAPSLPRWESFLINGHELGGDFPSGPYNRMISKLYGTGGESSETINRYEMENQQSTMGPTSDQPLFSILDSVQKKSPNRLLSASVQHKQDDMAASTHSGSQFLCSPNKKIHEDMFSRFGQSGAQLPNGEKQDESTKSGQSKDFMFSSFGLSGAQLPNGEKQDEPTRSGQSKDLVFSRFGSAGAQLPNGEKQHEPSNLVSVDGQSKGHDEKLKTDGVPPGVIFMCNRKTRQTCFQFRLFGLPSSQIKLVSRIVPGTKLFLFVLDSRELQGIFEATSNGGFNLNVNAFGGLFPSQEKLKRATVGPLPGVTQDIAGFKIANRPSIYVLDTPGILVPNIPDIDTGLKLSLTGAIKDSIVGEDRLAQYLLAILNTCQIPLHWKDLEGKGHEDSAHMFSEDLTGDGPEVSLHQKKKKKNVKSHRTIYTEDHTIEVKKALFRTFSEFEGNLENEDDLEHLIEIQLIALQKAFRVPPNSGEVGRNKVSKKLVHLYRIGSLGHYILDSIPNGTSSR